MSNITLGQYVDGKSIIHKLDPRTKLLSLMLLMVSVFLIPKPLTIALDALHHLSCLVHLL